MAKLNAYTLHDVKSLTYSPPFFQPNDAMAKRLLQDLVQDPNTTPGRHPQDFRLYKVGSFYDDSGILEHLEILEHVADAASYIPAAPAPFFNFDQNRSRQGDSPSAAPAPSNGKA